MAWPIHIVRGGMVSLAGTPSGTDRPPTAGAPAPVYPIAVDREKNTLAPAPLVDRYPFVVGQSLNATYLASVFRLCTTGYRQQFVDLLNELLEMDAHLFSVLQKRILSTANGRIEITPAKLPKGHADYERAKKIADDCQTRIDRIPDMTQTIQGLLWAIYNGLSASEIFWNRDGKGWGIDRFGFIHSRRLSYPDGQSWSLYIWDQGQVLGWQTPWGDSPTNSGIFGLRVADYPGKFLVHAPQLRGDYPTRDGVGRETAIWSLFKRIGARGASTYLERFAKSFMDVVYNTPADDEHGDAAHARAADKEDIKLAERIGSSIGAGSDSYGAHGSNITINPLSFDGGSSSKLTWQEWIGLCDGQESKAVLGGTLGTEVGKGGGNRALGEVQERGEVDLEQYDATTFGQSFKRDVLSWLVRLNFGDGAMHLVPNAVIHVDTDPDPKPLVELAKGLTEIGAPVDLDALAEQTGIALVPNTDLDDDGNPKPRRAYLPDVTPPAEVDPELESEESKQAKQDQTDADNAAAMEKAKQPPVAPGALPGKSIPAKAPAKGGKTPAKKPPAKAAKLRDDGDAEAAIAIVRHADGLRFLVVSRPESSQEMALPGGHVDDGEVPIEAAVRELAEETGIAISELRYATDVRSPLSGIRVHVFVVDAWTGEPTALEPETRVDWLTYRALFEQALFFRPTLRELHRQGLFDPIEETAQPPAAAAAP